MNILITGGTGLIGKALCAVLLSNGHKLTVLSRQSATAVMDKCGQVNPISSVDLISDDMQLDAIINLAGEPIVDKPWTNKRKQILLASRVGLTKALVAKLSELHIKPQVLLSGSAIGYYGDAGEQKLTEADTHASDFGAYLCNSWEAEANQAKALGIRVCTLRTGLVLAKQGGLLGKMLLPFKLGLGARLGSGKQWMSWVHIADYVGMVQHLLHDSQAEGAYNMTAPNPVTNADFTHALATAVNKWALFSTPAMLLNVALGQRAYMLLGSQRVLPAKFTQLHYPFNYASIDAALQSLV